MEKGYSEESFLETAKQLTKNIGKLTGKYYYVEIVQGSDPPKYNIFLGKIHVLQTTSYDYIIGMLNGIYYVYDNAK